MVTLLSKSIHRSTFARVVVLGLMALCGAASPLLGQETVAGKFTLTENTSLGKKFLPAGAYTFSIEPVGILQSVSSIQGARQVVQVVVRPETKAGPVAIIFAMVTRSARALDASKLVLAPVNNGMAMHSMYLDKQGLVLDFDWWSPKDKTQILAQAAGPEPASASKAID
ncbi:MAG: hypothetical protein DMG50_18920 [Acidobacteria bacterium]|nr:MAG: hypothetical protein DMG50_18920 [Acidobacteriota bacterium]